MSIQDDINKLDTSGSAKGQCAKCGDENLYSSIACSGCGARLPWADAVSDKARATASTHAPLSIASARATVNPPASSTPGSGGSRGPIAPAVATVLLIAGGLIGAAVVAPNFISRSETVQPTPAAGLQARPSAQAAPSSAPAYQAPPVSAPVAPAPQVAPPVQAPSRAQGARRAAPARQAPSVDASDNVPQIVADISSDIRNSRSKEETDAHAFACAGMVEQLNEKMRSEPDRVDIYSSWSSAMSALQQAAEDKSASFDDPGGALGQTKIYSMEASLNAARGSAISTQRFIEERRNPALARQRRQDFRDRANSYEQQQRPQNDPNSFILN